MRRITAATAVLSITMLTAGPALAQAAPTPSSGFEGATPVAYSVVEPAASDLGRAMTAFTTGRYRTAVARLEPLADGSMNPQLVLLTGFANLGAGALGRAELYFDRSLGLDRGSAVARQGLGLVALARGDRAAAMAQLEALDQAASQCAGQCGRAAEIERARTSLRRALG